MATLTSEGEDWRLARDLFVSLEQLPPDAIFGIKQAAPNKLNLGIGAFRTAEGKPRVLDVVRKVEQEQAADVKLYKEYFPIGGHPKFIELSQKLIFGEDCAPLKAGCIAGVQSISGTGALRLGMELIARKCLRDESKDTQRIYLPKPTWGNHVAIIKAVGMEPQWYSYYDSATRGLGFESMLADLRAAPEGSVILLHACAHNPTGVDPSKQQWDDILKLCVDNGLVPFFDCAYQGFASGSLEEDAYAVRRAVALGLQCLVAQSYSKNIGLYGERIGCLSIVCPSKERAGAINSQLQNIIRPMYSNPPIHGAHLVMGILGNEENYSLWRDELKGMAERIQSMRVKLRSEIESRNTPGSWQHITDQIGMFCFTGLTPEQVQALTDRHKVFLLKNGRINMAGLNDATCVQLADGVFDVLTNAKL